MPNHSELFTIIPQAEYLRMPWKNGLGETLEIAVKREDDEILYRISQAAVVEDGVFSDFSGLHRTLVLLKGQGMLLTHQSADKQYQHDLKQPLSIADFAGGDVTHAKLADGPIEDLNIMVREGRAVSNVAAVFASASFSVESHPNKLFIGFYANSDCELSIKSEAESVSISVKSQDTILIHYSAKVLVNKGTGVVINIFSE